MAFNGLNSRLGKKRLLDEKLYTAVTVSNSCFFLWETSPKAYMHAWLHREWVGIYRRIWGFIL
jgi:hypothetical protein